MESLQNIIIICIKPLYTMHCQNLRVKNRVMTDNSEDYKNIREFLQGNQSAFNLLVMKYQQKIYWHARRMTGNHLDADEIVQEVLLVMYNKLKTFKFESSLYTWIYSIVTTRSLNYIKKKKIRYFFSLDDFEALQQSSSDDIVSSLEAKDKLKMLDVVLQKLPGKQKEVFIMRTFEELSYEEISEITGTSIGGLKANYFHAIKKITEQVKDE